MTDSEQRVEQWDEFIDEIDALIGKSRRIKVDDSKQRAIRREVQRCLSEARERVGWLVEESGGNSWG